MTRRRTPTDGLAALSHEFRTPLNGVLGMARLLQGTRLTAEQRAYVSVLQESGEHLLSLVNDLLDHVKMGAGTLTLDRGPVEPAQLLQSVAELLSPRAHAKGLEIAWSAPDGLPMILADEGRLRQILLNLAGNAVKFTDEGGVLLSVAEVGREAGGLRLRFAVDDTGPGVPKDQQKRIFEAFAQASPNHAARPDSTGLGLAIVKRLADAHNGAVGVESATGQGASFWFEAAFPRGRRVRPNLALKGARIAVVSQNRILGEAARRQVEASAGEAVVCSSLEEAQDRTSAGSAVLIDHALAPPRRMLRPILGRPCLIMLAPEQRGHIGAYRQAGFAGYLIKPLRQASLADRVLAVLGRDPQAATTTGKDERAAFETAPGARVLLVEDNPINALLARKLLEREGCAVDWVTSGEAALDAYRPDHDLILMDRRLPGLDGLATSRALRNLGAATPIVALTADAFEEDRRLCLAAGMDDFLVKPLEPASLRAVLSRALSGAWTKPPVDAKLAS